MLPRVYDLSETNRDSINMVPAKLTLNLVNKEFLHPSSSAQTPTSGNVFQFSKNSIYRAYSGNESSKFRLAKIRPNVGSLLILRLRAHIGPVIWAMCF